MEALLAHYMHKYTRFVLKCSLVIVLRDFRLWSATQYFGGQLGVGNLEQQRTRKGQQVHDEYHAGGRCYLKG